MVHSTCTQRHGNVIASSRFTGHLGVSDWRMLTKDCAPDGKWIFGAFFFDSAESADRWRFHRLVGEANSQLVDYLAECSVVVLSAWEISPCQ